MEITLKIKSEIEEILNNNIKEIPYEGCEVNKYLIIEQFCELIKNLK